MNTTFSNLVIYSPGDIVKYSETNTSAVTYLANYYLNNSTPSLFIFNDFNIDLVAWNGGVWSSTTHSLATLNPPNLRGVYCPIPPVNIASPFYTMTTSGLVPFTIPTSGTVLSSVAGYNQIYGIAQGIVDTTSTSADVRYQSSANYTNPLITASFTILQTTGWTISPAWSQTTRPFGPATVKDSTNKTINFPGPRIYGPGITPGTHVISGSVVAQGANYVILWTLDSPINLSAVNTAYFTAGSTTIAPINTYRINHINSGQAQDADTTLMGFALPLTQAGGSSFSHLKDTIISHLSRGIKITPVKIKKRKTVTKRTK